MPYADPTKRREYQRSRCLTPEQKARRSERATERNQDPVVKARNQENARKYKASMTEAQKARRRELSRLRMAAKRDAMTPEQREVDRAYHREHDRTRSMTPERREYHSALKRRIRAANKFDREFEMPADMSCCNPNCNNPQVSDRYGPTGLCAEHLAATH